LNPTLIGSAARAGGHTDTRAANTIANVARAVARLAMIDIIALLPPPLSTATPVGVEARPAALSLARQRYLRISSVGPMPHRLEAAGSGFQTFGFCGWSRCHGRGSK